MTSFEIRTSERRKFKRCQQAWYWAYKEGLKPLKDSNPLWFGQAIHLALAEWYKPGTERGPHPAKTFSEALADGRVFVPESDVEQEDYVQHFQMGFDMLNRYVEAFGKDPHWEVIQPEMTFQVWLPEPGIPANKRWLRYVGTIDGVMRYVGPTEHGMVTGEIWLFEHKTAKSIQTAHLPLDDQAGSYWALAAMILRKRGILKDGETIAGIMYNFLRKAEDDPRPVNAEGFRCNKPYKQDYLDALTAWARENENRPMPSAKQTLAELEAMAEEVGVTVFGAPSLQQPAPYFERIPVYRSESERKRMIQRIRDEGLHIQSARSERPLLPIVKNPTKDCSWDCEFYRMCQLHEAGADWQAFAETQYKKWNPYEDHSPKSA